MSRTIHWNEAAEQDLTEICEVIDELNPNAAVKLISRIEAELGRLAVLPSIGHRRADVADARYLCRVVKPYVIVHRFNAETLRVVRIVHGARDFKRLRFDFDDEIQ